MREWIYCSGGYKWTFHKYKNEFLLDTGDNDKNCEKYYSCVIPGVFRILKFWRNDDLNNKPEEIKDPSKELYDKLMKIFFVDLKPIEKEDMINIALELLNKRPMLLISTLMGWTDYEDKTKDPNYFHECFLFPDGNKYTVVLHKGDLSVYPSDRDGFMACSSSLPLISRKIDLNSWAKRIYEDEREVITFKKE